jgi:hypothetical protein
MVTVRSAGSPKEAAGSAALRARARKMAVRHGAMPAAGVRRMGPRERKYESAQAWRSAAGRFGSSENPKRMDAVVVVAQVVALEPFLGMDMRDVRRVGRHDHDVVVQTGTTRCPSPEVATRPPSTADRTLIAGVIRESP